MAEHFVRFTDQDIEAARNLDPRDYLAGLGYRVTGNDRHIAVDHLVRVDRKPDGHWVACDWHGAPIGDNIALVRHFETKSFAEAVGALLGGSAHTLRQAAVSTTERLERPRLPRAKHEHMAAGRAYLQSRGISLATLQAAERARMLGYGPNAVYFLGYDEAGSIRSATQRMIEPRPAPDDLAKTIAKRDFAHSDKSYPAVLPGSPGARTLHVVEGGVDALALHEIARLRGAAAPTVIVSSGARVRSFLDNLQVQALVRQADRVVVHAENESRPEVQGETDAAHGKQAARIRELREGRNPASVTVWKPPVGKDLADYLQIIQGREFFRKEGAVAQPARQAEPPREQALERS